METTVENGVLVIRIPLTTPRLSASGKTHVVATTNGFRKTGAQTDGKDISVSVNAIVK